MNDSQFRKIAKALEENPDIEAEQVSISRTYFRDKGKWRLIKTTCYHCGINLKNSYILKNHRYVCEKINNNTEE